jgi:hypothetical protein
MLIKNVIVKDDIRGVFLVWRRVIRQPVSNPTWRSTITGVVECSFTLKSFHLARG